MSEISIMSNHKNVVRLLTFIIVLSLVSFVFVYEPLWNKISDAKNWSFGLDIVGGSLLTYDIDLAQVPAADRSSVSRGLRDVIERRINFTGVREPRVYLEENEASSRLIVELAGIKDTATAIQQIGETPLLDFREVKELPGTGTSTEQNVEFTRTELTGRFIKSAAMQFDTISGRPYVSLQFNDEGAKLFETLTERNVGKPIAIFLDDVLIEVPVVQEIITGGTASITGGFTVETARSLVERFNAGALPAPIRLVNQEVISADLGSDSLRTAVLGGMLGTLLIIAFMLVFYRAYGIYACVALLMYIAITLAVFKLIPITLTLAGIAGFILSIGMAVDANILVFERTKEELERGLERGKALEEGFRRAWSSIRDSNLSTMITSFVLYYFTSSFVRGFALALFVGVIISMFSAITITRTLMRVAMSRKK